MTPVPLFPSGAVDTQTTPVVQYSYADGADNTIRPTTVTYPDGRVVTYDYGTPNSAADALSRIASIVDDDLSSTHLADYSYLGLGTFVETDYTQPQVKYTLIGTAGDNDPDTADIYRGLDRFGRIKDSDWYDYGSSTNVDRIQYGYDRNSNRLWRRNIVAESLGKHFDELYGYDPIDRLQTMARGDLDSLKSQISNPTFRQHWALDPVGNWENFREDTDGDGAWDLDQHRTANPVNEITDINETTGPSWITPAYDPAGNMTTIPKPADPTVAFNASFDAWNRLVKIAEGSDTVAEYAYDGAKRRTIAKSYNVGELEETYHLLLHRTRQIEVIEERINACAAADRQLRLTRGLSRLQPIGARPAVDGGRSISPRPS